MQIDENQKKAIEHDRGPMLVLAGPGSGKTTVITKRTQWLIEQMHISPGEILVVTFTRAAAREMRTRFDQLVDGRHLPVSFGTFHAVFFTILKYAYNYKVENIIRDDERYRLLRTVIERVAVDIDDDKTFVMDIAGEISKVKGDLISVDHFYPVSCSKDVFTEIYTLYNESLRNMRKLDYDDMLLQTWELFKKYPDILKAWQQKYKYILIDEFQDINQIQYEIIKMLALPENNLFIVGDDDQSIYRFRGAKPEILLGFSTDYPNTKQVILNMNYRSTAAIVKRAEKVIENNRQRYHKNMQAYHQEGNEVVVKAFQKPADQYKKIIREVIDLHETKGISWNDIAVIFRMNMQISSFVEQLMVYNVPFVMKDALPNIYNHWITKDIFSYIKIASGDNQRTHYLRIINKPNRYNSRSYLDDEVIDLDVLMERYEDKEWMCQRIDTLEHDLYMLSSMAPYAALHYIRYSVGYESYLRTYALEHGIKEEDLIDVLDELTDKSYAYQTWDEWCLAIEKYEEELKTRYQTNQEDSEGVRLLTMHGAKGLEYDIVYIPDANDGITPYKKALKLADREEERRMFYVAMTRAKQSLFVYFTRERYGKHSEISPFVKEVLQE